MTRVLDPPLVVRSLQQGERHVDLQATAHRRLNVGCGDHPLLYWTNCDESRKVPADLYIHVPPLPHDNASLDEIYAGHFFEHLTQEEAHEFLRECLRCLVSGGRLGLLVPDTREIMTRWLHGSPTKVEYPTGVLRDVSDLDEVCAMFLYSTVQESPHRWSYDLGTLRRLLERHGFQVIGEIDRFKDPRIPPYCGRWYQMGWDAVKP